MSARKHVLSLVTAFVFLVTILAGCISGATVRTDTGGGGGGSPTPAPTDSPGPAPTPTPVPGTGGVTVLDSGRTNIFDVAQDTVNVYYTVKVANNGMVLAVPKNSDGTVTPVLLASGGNANTPWGIACDPGATGYVYYTDHLPNPQGTLYRVPKPVNGAAVGTPEVLATGLNMPTFLRLNDVLGGDGLLYTCENTSTAGRILRFSTNVLSQNPTAATFVNIGANTVPAYNMHFFNVNGVVQLWFTLMASDLTTGNTGELRVINTGGAGNAPITSTTLVATGLLNPTDLWLFQTTSNTTSVLWTEYDQAAGGVRSAPVDASQVRGTPVGVSGASVSFLPPVSIKVSQSGGTAYVTRNAQQVNGGGFYLIDLPSDVATALTVTVGGQTSGAVNFPFQFVGDSTYGLFATEFNFGSGDVLSTQPSNLVRLGFPVSFGKRAAPVIEEGFLFRHAPK